MTVTLCPPHANEVAKGRWVPKIATLLTAVTAEAATSGPQLPPSKPPKNWLPPWGWTSAMPLRTGAPSHGLAPEWDIRGPVLLPQLFPCVLEPASSPHGASACPSVQRAPFTPCPEKGDRSVPPALTDHGPALAHPHSCCQRSVVYGLCLISMCLLGSRTRSAARGCCQMPCGRPRKSQT